jgi:hypothetical protein
MLVSLPPNNCLFSDHSASDILKNKSLPDADESPASFFDSSDVLSPSRYEEQKKEESTNGATRAPRPSDFKNSSRLIISFYLRL